MKGTDFKIVHYVGSIKREKPKDPTVHLLSKDTTEPAGLTPRVLTTAN